MKYLAFTALMVLACGRQKVEVSDSEHEISIDANLCEVFDDLEERKDCVRSLLKALQKEDCKP